MVSSSRSRLAGPPTTDWEFPRAASGVRHLVRFAETHGVAAGAVLAGTGLEPADVGPGGVAEVTAAQELRAVRGLRRHLPDAGRAVGLTYSVASFGAMGFAVRTSRTVGDAVDVALRFFDLSFAFVIPDVVVSDGEVVAVLDASRLPADVRGFLLERDAAAVGRVLEDLVPGGVGLRSTPGPGPHGRTLRFGVEELDRPLPQGDARGRSLAEAVCDDVVGRRRARTGLTQDVRVLIPQRLPEGAPMGAVADGLGLSERTLRRRLGEHATSYRALVEEVRSALAADLLGRGLPVAEVAARLGYSETAALTHAHRRWTGRAPTAAHPD